MMKAQQAEVRKALEYEAAEELQRRDVMTFHYFSQFSPTLPISTTVHATNATS